MATRVDVINTARTYLNVPAWTPNTDTYLFDRTKPGDTFHSAFLRRTQYTVVPYVYGGFDSPTEFLQRMGRDTCPGGWDRHNGHGTEYWYSTLGYAATVPNHLAGIDCSGYVLRCWGFAQRHDYDTEKLPGLCTKIVSDRLQKGDILDKIGSHVILFDDWAPSGITPDGRLTIYEAHGGDGESGSFTLGSEFGYVVHHTIPWPTGFVPYSPFPQLADVAPLPGTHPKSNPRTRITANIEASGEIRIDRMTLNDRSVNFKTKAESGRIEVSYQPESDLPVGSNTVRIATVNRIAGHSFSDDLTWQFFLT